MQLLNPTTISAPNGTYSHGVLLERPAELLLISGQVAIDASGSIPGSIEEQADLVWSNIEAILNQAGMGINHLVKITSFLTRPGDIAAFVKVRARRLGTHRPSSTLLVVAALANPKFLVEIEAIASRG